MLEPSKFYEKVIRLILKIPRGRVATYGQIARLAGKPHGSRGVGWILHSSSARRNLPWQRVIGASGKISFPRDIPNFERQRRRLIAEGVEVSFDGKVELPRFQWSRGRTAGSVNRRRPRKAAVKGSRPSNKTR